MPSPLRPISLVLLILAIGCATRSDRGPVNEGKNSAPSMQELEGATYTGFEGLPEAVTLVDGRWEGEPYVEGGSARPVVFLMRDFRLVEDLDGDGMEEAVILLAQRAGGTGEYLYLAIVDRRDGRPYHRASALIGDRVGIRAARVEEDHILLDVLQAGPKDAFCCPGELAMRSWRLLPGDRLTESTMAGQPRRLSLATLAGTEWVLRAWGWDEPAPASPEVTLVYRDGQFAGMSGCNNYFATAEEGEQPGEVSVGPVGATRRYCPEPAMSVEDRFLKQLGAVRKYGFSTLRLALTFEDDGGLNVMLFEGREPDHDRDRR